jgi:hypothetical protein
MLRVIKKYSFLGTLDFGPSRSKLAEMFDKLCRSKWLTGRFPENYGSAVLNKWKIGTYQKVLGNRIITYLSVKFWTEI